LEKGEIKSPFVPLYHFPSFPLLKGGDARGGYSPTQPPSPFVLSPQGRGNEAKNSQKDGIKIPLSSPFIKGRNYFESPSVPL